MGIQRVIDQDGELVGTVVPKDEGYVIIHQNSRDAFKQKLEDRNSPKFIKCFTKEIKKLTHLSLTQCGYLLHILTYMSYNQQGYLLKDGEYINQKEMCFILSIKGKQMQTRLFKRLTTDGIIIKEGQKIKISESFHAMGETAEKAFFTKLHKKKTKELILKLKPREVGMIYKILPFVNFKYGVLCANPEEENIECINFLSQEELAELIHEDLKTVSRSMKILDEHGAAMVIRSGKTDNFIVHPDFIMRMKYSQREALLTFFKLNEAKRKYSRNRTSKK